jgi:hypothetical protein
LLFKKYENIISSNTYNLFEQNIKMSEIKATQKTKSSKSPRMEIEEKIKNSLYIPKNIWDLLKDE